VRAVLVHAAGEVHVLGLDAQGPAGAFDAVVALALEVFARETVGGEDLLLDRQGLALGQGHAVTDQGAGGGDLEAIRARLLGGRVLDQEPRVVLVLDGEVARQHPIHRPAAHPPRQHLVEHLGLKGRNPQPAEAFVDGLGGGAGLTGLHEAGEDSAFQAAVARPELHRPLKVARVKSLAGTELLRVVQIEVGPAQQRLEQVRVIHADQGGAQRGVVAAATESLLAEIVRHPALLERVEHRPNLHDVGRVDLANLDDEAVALEVAQAQLVEVAVDPQDADAVDLERRDRLRGRAVDREHLAGDRAGVLHAGVADRLGVHAQGGGDTVDGVECGEVDLLDFAVDVLALAGWFVEGDFGDGEVLRALLDDAADAGEVVGEVGEVH
jgi:hypothetical protein